jgi:hypothetical protein
MASPHAAGIAAVLYGRYPSTDPATITEIIRDDATADVVSDPRGSPNLLAYIGLRSPGVQRVYLDLPALYLSEPPITLSGVATSGQLVTYTSQTPSTCSVSSSSLTPLATGTCTIRASTVGSDGWLDAQLDASTTVYVTRQTISIALWSELAWGSSVALDGLATSGLPVSYYSYSAACSVTGETLQGTYVADCPMLATQAGNGTYGPAPPVAFERSVHPASQVLSGPVISPVQVGATVPYEGLSSAGLPVDVNSASPAICTTAAGTLTTLALGECDLRLTQIGSEGVSPTGSTSLRAVTSTTPWFTRLALRDDGRAVIAYAEGGRLHLVQCADLTCASHSEQLLVDLAQRYQSLPEAAGLSIGDVAITTIAGRPVIAYTERTVRPKPWQDYRDWDEVLRLLVCSDAPCSTWTDQILDDPDPLVDISVTAVSIAAVDSAPVIAYAGDNFGLRYLACGDLECDSYARSDVASDWPADYGTNPSLAIAPDGLPVIGYLAAGQNPISGGGAPWATAMIARCLDLACNAASKQIAGDADGWFKPAIVVPADNRPVLFWTENVEPHQSPDYGHINYRVDRARCNDPSCDSVGVGIIDETPGWNSDGSVFRPVATTWMPASGRTTFLASPISPTSATKAATPVCLGSPSGSSSLPPVATRIARPRSEVMSASGVGVVGITASVLRLR